MNRKSNPNSIYPSLAIQLTRVARRDRWRRVFGFLAVTWLAMAILAAIVFIINRSAESSLDTYFSNAWLPIGITAAVASLLAIIVAMITTPSTDQVAERIENKFSDLDSVLLTAIEQSPDSNGSLSFFQHDVIHKALTHGHNNRWRDIIPFSRLLFSGAACVLGLFGLIAGCLALYFMPQPEFDPSLHLFDGAQTATATPYELMVQPGDAKVERGTSLLVLAQFGESVPANADLCFEPVEPNANKNESTVEQDQPANTDPAQVIPMTKSLDDPVFASRISQINLPLTYKIAYDEQESESFRIDVFDYPKLVRSDADLEFPTYTELEDKKLQDVRRVSAVVGTKVTLKFFVNKPLENARLVPDRKNEVESRLPGESNDMSEIELSKNPNDQRLWQTTFVVDQSKKFRLRLVDGEGRENKSPPRISITAVMNQPPIIKLLEPSRDLAVSAIEEISLHATAWDDFGVQRVGLNYSIGGEESNDLVLAESKAAKEKHPVEHLLELEKLDATPDMLVSYHFWAEDKGPNGETRRTASDMFFAEVRRFEEIYRQAQGGGQPGPPSEAGQNAERAAELAELQKEIINATWRVNRREIRPEPTKQFPADADLLIESQQSAITQVDEFVQQLTDAQSKAFADELKSLMSQAVNSLQEAKASIDSGKLQSSLKSAIQHEQAAYQTLLKMRAREFQVQQQQQSQQQQQQSSQSRQQRQMQQMDLKEQEDRYEQERLAEEQTEQAEEQQENRQILSRLRELARRQNDLNKRVKELQSALEEAETQEEKEDIEKRLKRLQEEQEQILRDTDELQERMSQPENQERMAEQSEQLEQARENVQKSSEALEQRDISQAAAEGTRAERELKDLRDEFQKRTSGQFNEQMRQMRNEARDLEQEQQKLAEDLEKESEQAQQRRTTLESNDDQADVLEQMREGQETVEELRERIKQTIEEAEEFEPLLADELYDTYRDSEQTRPDRALESAQQAWERGFNEDAQHQQRKAVEGIEKFREGIDRAAESVLGDETEALKVARNTLDELSGQLEDEIRRDQPEKDTGQGNERGQETETTTEDESKPGQQPGGEGENKERKNEDSENEESQNQQPGNQPGQGEGKPNENQDPSESEQEGQQGQQGQGGGQPNDEPQDGQQGDQQSEQPQRGQRGGNRLGGDPNSDPATNRERIGQLGGITGANNAREWAPIAGEDFRQWSDRLRDVEEMIADPDLRAEAARIRDRAKAIRKDIKRHSREPNWDLVKMELAEPLVELQTRVTQELLRRDGKDSLVPLNREPVPPRYENAVQRYYEKLGTGQ